MTFFICSFLLVKVICTSKKNYCQRWQRSIVKKFPPYRSSVNNFSTFLLEGPRFKCSTLACRSFEGDTFISPSVHFSPSAKCTDWYIHVCSKDINVSQVTSISQMLWAPFKAQGIPWQETSSTFRRNFPISKSALLDPNKRAGPTCLAPVTSF